MDLAQTFALGWLVAFVIGLIWFWNSLYIIKEWECGTREGQCQAAGHPRPGHLQTLTEIGVEKNTTVVFPLPVDIINGWMKSQTPST